VRRVLGIVSFFVLILRNLFRQRPDHDLSVAGRADRTISMLGGRLADALTPTSIELSDVSADVGSV